MKRCIFFLIFLSLGLLVACSKYDDGKLWDKVNDLDSRLAALEKQCKEMNTNIASMKVILDALQTNDYITNVTVISENGIEIGYKLDFKTHPSITIYHGKNGEAGQTPVIGIKQAEDGYYYWTQKVGDQTTWLLDEGGNKIKSKGEDGEDGVTPQLRINNNKWELSVDNGVTWSVLGEASGDSFFKNVINKEDILILELADGAVVTLPKGATFSVILDKYKIEDILPNTTYEINYTVVGGNEQVSIQINAPLGWNVYVETAGQYNGKILITTPEIVTDEKVYVIFSDGETAVTRVLPMLQGRLVHVEEPGTLKDCFSGEADWRQCKRLKITGTLNNDDYVFLKDKMQSLRFLDLSEIDNETLREGFFSGHACQTVILPEKLVAIPSFAFDHSGITSIKIPDGVREIGNYAFYNCRQLRGDLHLPYIIQTIGEHAFELCSFDGNLSLGAMLQKIGKAAFKDCKFTGKLTIPTQVGIIEDEAFAYCSGFTGLVFSANTGLGEPQLTSIGISAFEGCSGFRGDLVLPDRLANIGDYAFRYCSEEWKGRLVIGKSVKKIGDLAFIYNGPAGSKYRLNFEKIYFKSCFQPEDVMTGLVLNWEPRIEYVGVPLGCSSNYINYVEKYVEVMEEVDYTTFDF